ncbi:MAG: DNRLRE domain-containing protein [Candidatus Latescibacterota bacterium]
MMISALWRGVCVVGTLAVFGGLAGCASEEGSPVGASLLIGRDFGEVVSKGPIETAQDSSYRAAVSMGQGKNLVGRAAGLTARALLIFPASVFSDAVRNAQLEEATLELIFDRTYGSESGTDEFELALYPVTSDWSEEGVLSDTPPTYDPVAVWSSSVSAAQSDTIRCVLPISRVQGWVNSTSEGNFGLLIAPASPLTASFIKWFGSTEVGPAPALRIRYTAAGKVDSTVVHPAEDAILVDRALPLATEGNLIVAEGDIYRTLLLFDLPEVDSLVTVNSAVLTLEVDPERSPGTLMTLEAWPVIAASWEQEAQRVAFVGDPPHAVIGDTTTALSLDVRLMVQDWLRAPARNAGILLRSAGEQESIFSILLENPRLSITYSEPPGRETAP